MLNFIFTHTAWLKVIAKTYNFNIKIVEMSLDNGFEKFKVLPFEQNFRTEKEYLPFVEKGIKKLKYISLPFTDFIDTNKNLVSKSVFDYLINENKIEEIEIRNSVDDIRFQKKIVGYKHTLDLTKDEDEIFNSFKITQVKQPIKKSIKEGLKVEIKNDLNSIQIFYDLHILTRKKLGVPIQPKNFFANLWREIISKGLGYIVLVYFEKRVISAGIFIGVNNICFYKFSASDNIFLKYRPNNLMLWTGIQEAKKRGFKIFDFGRTDLETEGLRKFKLGWGTIEEPLYYSYYPKAPDKSKFDWLKDKVVKPIIRNSPNFVCRLSGELFYKYFG